jgi:hypothetical protein
MNFFVSKYEYFSLGLFMSPERLKKWNKESQEFFEKAEDNSIVLDIFISYFLYQPNMRGI